ncbi:MAG: hypothetical protein JW891_11950 [Candidatus Lokiarchaeota archaeon]|nr:hypothetical protein [Candidatus Lokiarchaeota archaeon]
MKSILPFRREDEATYYNHIHPVIRFILPFILVIPFLILNNIYLIVSTILITILFGCIVKLKFLKVLSRIIKILPFVLLMTVFLPFYIGSTVLLRYNGVIPLTIYAEGTHLALLLFLRIFGAIFVFLSFFSSLTYSEFIETLTKLRIPSIFTGSLVIMLHYIPILASSNRKILLAQELRGKKITTYKEKIKTHAFIMGKSIVMNMERSEKLYEALKMRGFSGKLTFASRKFKLIDVITLSLFIVLLVIFLVMDLEQIYMGVTQLLLP